MRFKPNLKLFKKFEKAETGNQTRNRKLGFKPNFPNTSSNNGIIFWVRSTSLLTLKTKAFSLWMFTIPAAKFFMINSNSSLSLLCWVPCCLCCPNICFSFRSYFYFCICKSKCSNKNTNATEDHKTPNQTSLLSRPSPRHKLHRGQQATGKSSVHFQIKCKSLGVIILFCMLHVVCCFY